MNIAQAIEAPRIHHQWLPDRIDFESRALSRDTQVILRKKGHIIYEYPDNIFIGSAMGVISEREKGPLSGSADSRSPDGGVSGY
jgi:gamma-glutamyltranspeptidase/glutathione hydrolase